MNRKERCKAIQTALLKWYRRHQRDLPWRRTRDPYAIWLAEVMLQQTQVETVKPYYDRFLAAFPSIDALADAPLDAVLKTWEGLGYYSRARNLHRAARRVVAEHDGELPRTVDELLDLPGIGRYTAGAIASIAFGLDEPVLDGNVTRVLCRLFRIREQLKAPKTQRKLWSLAQTMVPRGRAALLNQAMMDLGATICIPREPRCATCPVEPLCQARAKGEQSRLPIKAKRKPLPHYEIGVGIVWRRNRILIDQRKPEGLLGGLWEFPGGKRRRNESLEDCVVREVREELNVEVKVRRPLAAVNHAYSHFRITMHAFECDYVSGRPKAIGCTAWKWITLDELDDYAFPSANRKVIAALRKHSAPRRK